MMKKIETLSLAAALTACLVAPAYAGERRGDGGWTAIDWNGSVAAADCAYSGLEDYHEEGSESDPLPGSDGSVVPGDTQTPHAVGGFYPPPGAASTCQYDNHGRKPSPEE